MDLGEGVGGGGEDAEEDEEPSSFPLEKVSDRMLVGDLESRDGDLGGGDRLTSSSRSGPLPELFLIW
jgi:hypothetical protein